MEPTKLRQITTRKGRRFPKNILDRYEVLLIEEESAESITITLEEEFPGDAPDKRTIERWLKADRPPDLSGEWSTIDADPDTIGPVLDVLATVIESTEGRITSLTNAEASWVVKILTARPDLPPWDTWYLVRLYVVRELHRDTTADLDTYLAFKPWVDHKHEVRYSEAINAAGIPAAPIAIHKLIERGDAVLVEEDGTRTPVYVFPNLPESSEAHRRRPNRDAAKGQPNE